MATLDALLASLALDAFASVFADEELTLETLRWMAADSADEFTSSMEELGLASDDAARLLVELTKPPPELPDEDLLELVGRRVLISGLKSKAELNGKCGTVLSHDLTSGRYTVKTEETPSVTVALRPINIDAEAAKKVPLPTRPEDEPAFVDVTSPLERDQPAKPGDQLHESDLFQQLKESATTMEAPERVAAYLAASKWGKKKEVDPRSAEAFYKKKNKEKREDDDARLDAWKKANPQLAAQLEANKARARATVGYSLGERGQRKSGSGPNGDGGGGGGGDDDDDVEDGEDSSAAEPASKPAASKKLEETPDIADALKALRTAAASAQASAPRASASGGAAPPTADLLASVLGKVGATPPAAPSATAMAALAKARPPAAPVPVVTPCGIGSGSAATGGAQDLLAAALAKSGVAGGAGGGARGGRAAEALRQGTALDAYQKRQTNDSTMTEGDVGTVNKELQAKREFAAARAAEAKYRDKHAFVGEHYNAI